MTTATEKRQDAPVPANEPVYIPRVDIREDAERFTVLADMPGADEKTAEATVHNRVLTIEGWCQTGGCPTPGEELGCEFRAGRYRRDFTLPETVDAERIQARIKNGTLTVTLPKREEVKARKIQVTT
ncbi:MAG TPA: Hsp20/alpha crystallin family protein [Kiritimatiellia bacterium]|jgi:HSP20 family protein|nr:Hsp20/alpha crystallin family protein [Kiritimatiellia bacterium]OQC60503.1 MAG: Spore protein SP21 [Verrucomicrobia bacterium ADurb.Bin018]MBP9572806.1 Hsp20/alpha crystallin family protein [Kiritimatiellia bacterium]HOD99850.1 Hsp20/alpha crystallin family protein [Kiritimatiellia bacterium]HOE35969.1 Hsp20/alpha crystallin family protein [Kiritimatiellia bacterium]